MLDEGKIDPEEQTLRDMDALAHDEQIFYRGFLAGYEVGYGKCVENLEKLVKREEEKRNGKKEEPES